MMPSYSVDVIYKRAYRMTVVADNEQDALQIADIEAPEIIDRGFASLKHIEYEVYSIHQDGEVK
jgi:hypothetical protein